ncbi:MAG TPA: hypothetical protein VK627_04770 [Edaphobacter sp.]|nr:hypothetical protein [Edaphobacter sp.]
MSYKATLSVAPAVFVAAYSLVFFFVVIISLHPLRCTFHPETFKNPSKLACQAPNASKILPQNP